MKTARRRRIWNALDAAAGPAAFFVTLVLANLVARYIAHKLW